MMMMFCDFVSSNCVPWGATIIKVVATTRVWHYKYLANGVLVRPKRRSPETWSHCGKKCDHHIFFLGVAKKGGVSSYEPSFQILSIHSKYKVRRTILQSYEAILIPLFLHKIAQMARGGGRFGSISAVLWRQLHEHCLTFIWVVNAPSTLVLWSIFSQIAQRRICGDFGPPNDHGNDHKTLPKVAIMCD